MKLFGLSFANVSGNGSHIASSMTMVCCILLRAILKRFQLTSIVRQWRSLPNDSAFKKVWKLLQLLEVVTGFVSIGNLLQFFSSGLFPSVSLRASGLGIMKAPNPYPGGNNGVSALELHYRYRQVLWTCVAGVFASGSLDYNWTSFLATLYDFTSFVSHDIMHTIGPLFTPSSDSRTAHSGDIDIVDSTRLLCCVCKRSPPENPYVTSCGHVYCYVCVYFSVRNSGCDFDALENEWSGRAPQPRSERPYRCHSCRTAVSKVRRL